MNRSKQILRLTLTALLMSMNIVFSFTTLTIPTPVGNIYFCNAVINVAAVLLDPVAAFVAGGVGSLLGDLLSGYAQAMLVSLVAHGLQAMIVSLCARHLRQMKLPLRSLLGMAAGSVWMVAAYTIGRAYIYGHKEWAYAISKIPMEFLQAGIGIAVAMLLLFVLGILESFRREIGEPFGMHEQKRSEKR